MRNDHGFIVLANAWLERKETELKISTVIRYRSIIKNYLELEFGGCMIEKITAKKTKDYLKRLENSGGMKGKGLAVASVRIIATVIKAVFAYAREMEGIKTADISELKIRLGRKSMRVLTESEQVKIEKSCMADKSEKGVGVILCLCTGIRIGELCTLKWKDISIEERRMNISRTVYRVPTENNSEKKTEIIETAPKSISSIREIPLSVDMCRLLTKIKSGQDDYILSGSRKIVEPRRMQYYFAKLTKKNNIVGAKFHSLRHTFATRSVECGVDPKSLSEILGHSSVQITMDRYVHPTMEMKEKSMERISKKLMKNIIKNIAE